MHQPSIYTTPHRRTELAHRSPDGLDVTLPLVVDVGRYATRTEAGLAQAALTAAGAGCGSTRVHRSIRSARPESWRGVDS